MNRFRSRKKSRDGATIPHHRTSDDSEVPTLPMFSTKSFKKNKKTQPEAKSELDLSTALPSSDDFRTSLLMPNLSARFSMLREQDDPTSMLGKANDDSVLHPKRKSRLGDFGFQPGRGPLTDIAEVGPINGTIRPPFAYSRMASYGSGDGYGTDDDSSSIISRSRPGEGNNLFGGRQKIYKIPIGGSASLKNVDESGNQAQGRGMGGRALYGDDVSSSAFQKLREREREAQRLTETSRGPDLDVPASDHTNSSPSSSYNKNRDTISSTTSGPSNARISTAATSIASQGANSISTANGTPLTVTPTASAANPVSSIPTGPPERAPTKSRRLYEQGLDQHLYDQQSSAASRLENLQRQRAHVGGSYAPHLSHNDILPNAPDRHYRRSPPPPSVAGDHRAASPPPPVSAAAAFSKFDLGIADSTIPETSDHPAHKHVRPMSPTAHSQMHSMSPTCEEEDTFAAAVEPKDRGKATALGTFNKPSQQYDERQYSQRQIQMQQGRNTPTPPPGRTSPPRTAHTPFQEAGRPRNQSNASYRSRSASAVGRNYFFQPQGPLPNGNSPTKALSPSPTPPVQPDPHGTFLAPATPDRANSPIVTEEPCFDPPRFRRPADIMAAMQTNQEASRPLENSFKKNSGSEQPPTNPRRLEEQFPSKTIGDNYSMHGMRSNTIDGDSPTLGPNGSLHGLVSAHLRGDSGSSSIYTAPSPGPSSSFTHTRQKSNSSIAKPSINSRPGHEFDNWDSGYYPEAYGPRPVSPNVLLKPNHSMPNGTPSKAMKVLGQEPVRTSHGSFKIRQSPEDYSLNNVPSKAMKVLGEDPVRTSHESPRKACLPEEPRGRHTKNASTETQREKEDFANELAHRRKMVQENLKSFTENESRSTSPAPTHRKEYPKDLHMKPLGAFSMLKPKTSRGSLACRQEAQEAPSKAMKMLGIAGPNPNEASGHPRQSEEDRRRQQEERMLRGFRGHQVNAPPINKTLQQARHDIQRDHKQRQRGNSDENNDNPNNKEPSPPSSRGSARDRSSSEASGGQAKSRNGRYRDDLQKAMVEGAGSTANHGYPDMPRDVSSTRKFSNTPVPSPEVHQRAWEGHSSPALSGRLRSNSRSGYFDSPSSPHMPIQTKSSVPMSASRPSPVTPFSPKSTPPVSAISSPTTGVAPQPFPTNTRTYNYRKRSINKHDISEPIFMSGTSNFTTVNLAPGASLSNGIEVPPPLPAFSPRRKRTTTTQAFFGAFGRGDKTEDPSMPSAMNPSSPQEELSTFSADESKYRPRHKHKLRKSSSEGGNLNIRARQQAMQEPSPAMPNFPASVVVGPMKASPPNTTMEGGMF